MRLATVPVTLFTMVMGLCGFTLAMRAGETAAGLTHLASGAAHLLTLAVFVVVAFAYLAKALRHPGAVAEEWAHPVSLAFFPAISIALLLFAVVMLERAPGIAHALWLIAVPVQLILTLAVVSGWIGSRAFQHGHLTPAWFIPAVGNVVVAVAGVPLGYVEASWFFTSIGLIFWLVLLALVMNRLIFHDPLPERLQPTLVILIAPPAVGYLAWLSLVGEVDAFARVLLNGAYLFALIVAVQAPRLLRLPFSLAHWALSFPLAAVTVASFEHAEAVGSAGHRLIGYVLMLVLVAIIAGLLWRTGQGLRRGALFGG
ncbi:SLAC1 anion channel family protein [Roseovarius autotrophicus]|uniref:SLAC1 anion channel family protein n=1 Tax=Roseovarius autotrophicus TaxID=2824121 RepID=UPI001A03ACEB|nr:SLAC1 anion channel family protein [Roseovarius autotrophicus]MBE0453647.1 SLAC1 anion channel family protein [Roseovarius sp.]